MALIFIIGSGCFHNSNPTVKEISFNDSTYLKFHIKNCKSPVNLSLYYNLILPPEQVNLSIIFQKDTVEIIKLKINHPLTIELSKSNSYASCFCLPKDTLEIWIDMKPTNELKNIIEYKGKTASISDYLTQGKIKNTYTPVRFEKDKSYNERVDLLTKKKLWALHAFDKKVDLPKWFVKMEELEIRYSGARDKIYQYKIRYLFNYNYKEIPDDLTDNLGVKLDNPKAKYIPSYYSLLSNISTIEFYKYTVSQNVNPEMLYTYVIANIDFAQKYLHSEMRDLYIAQRICVLFSNQALNNATISYDSIYFQRLESLTENARSNFKDNALKNFLFAYQKQQLISPDTPDYN